MKLREILSVFPLVSRNAAAHCLAVDADGRCYSWGRNECGQLGHGHQTDLNQPTIIEALAGQPRHFLEIPRLPASLLPCLSGSLPLCPLSSAPYPVPASSKRIVAVASGRNHSLAVADDGSCALFLSSLRLLDLNPLPPLLLPPSLPPSLYFPLLPPFCRSSLFLLNPLPNPVRTEHEKKPVLSAVKRVRAVACGGEFSCWITHPDPSTTTTTTPPSNDATTTKAAAAAAAAGGGAGGAAQPSEPPSPPNLFTAGLPQYGQLGHGTDNEYNAKDSAVKLVYAPQPTPRAVAALAGREMCKVACGINHSVDAKGFVFTWGFGGFGRLGHKEQKDEWRPRLVDVFQRQNTLPPTAVVAAGGAFSACTAGGGQMYAWGKVKQTGDCWMYPKPLLDLSGWHIRSMACGATTSCVAADSSTISWGLAQHGELGYGPNGAKSSANPKKIDSLEGIHSVQVAGGVGFFLHLVSRTGAPGDSAEQRSKAEKLLAALPLFTPEPDTTSQKPAGKGKAAGTGRRRKKEEKEEAVVEEEGGDEEGGEEDEDEEVEEVDSEEEEDEEESASKKRKGRGGKGGSAGAKKGRGAAAAAAGRGRGGGKGKAAGAAGGKGKAARGRGRGKRK
ncbi:unnamed protein product [Closterium sp. NIES-64]|nr:unnamed protein product [Closterium sp. NIES-64]